MTAIWLLSTKGRPKEAQETIDACQEAGMTSRGIVYVDETVDEYRGKLTLPANWEIHYEPEWLGLQGSMQYVMGRFPDASQYGWLADDTRPRTKGWDKKLEEAAGKWRLAYARDLWMSENPGMLEQLLTGNDLSSGLCWGGELVRTVGWWALPGVKQAGIDTAWTALVRPLELYMYVEDVTVEHLNWRTGKRVYDDTDQWDRDGRSFIQDDLYRRGEWVCSSDYRNTLRRLGLAVGDPKHLRDSLWVAMRESYANHRFQNGGLNAARLKRIMEGELDTSINAVDGVDPDTDQRPARLDPPVRQVGSQPDVRRVGADHP